MDKDTVNDIQQLVDEIEVRLIKVKKLMESSTFGGNAPDSSIRVLAEVDDAGGIVSKEEWLEIGKKHGMDARGLGGFFVGEGSMICIGGDKRALTERGMKMVKRWRANNDQKEVK